MGTLRKLTGLLVKFDDDELPKKKSASSAMSEEELLAELGLDSADGQQLQKENQSSVPAKVREPIHIETVFAEANLPEAKFPAEKLLKMLDGMTSLTAETQRISVQAMAAAGDWTVEGVVEDAAAKLAVIEKTINEFGATSTNLDKNAQQDIKNENEYLAEATKTIQEEMQKLEQKLQEQMKTVKTNIESIRATCSAKQDEVSECVAEMRREQKKYQRILGLFPQQQPLKPDPVTIQLKLKD